MKTPLAGAIEAVCRLANLEPERTARILAAAECEKRPVVEKLLNTRQAAAILGCCVESVFRYAKRGKLHPVRRSARLIRWRQSEVEKLLMGEGNEGLPCLQSGNRLGTDLNERRNRGQG